MAIFPNKGPVRLLSISRNNSLRSRYLAWIVALSIPVAILAPKGLAPTFVLAVLGTAVLHFAAKLSSPPVSKIIAGWLALIVIWGGASFFWSVSGDDTLALLPGLAGTMLGGLFLVTLWSRSEASEQETIIRFLLAAYFAGLAFTAYEYFSEIQIIRFLRLILLNQEIELFRTYTNFLNGGSTLFVLLLFPVFHVIRQSNKGASWIAVAATVSVVFLAGGFAFKAALLLGGAVYLFGAYSTKWMTRLVFGVVVVGALAAPAIPAAFPDVKVAAREWKQLPDSFFTRLFIWQSTNKLIAEAPILGNGLNSARSFYSDKDSVVAFDIPRPWGGERILQPIPLHTHNGVLQIWLELGLVGVVLFVGFLLSVLQTANSRIESPPTIRMIYATFVTALTIFCLSYGAWQSWWLASLWLTGLIVVIVSQRRTS